MKEKGTGNGEACCELRYPVSYILYRGTFVILVLTTGRCFFRLLLVFGSLVFHNSVFQYSIILEHSVVKH